MTTKLSKRLWTKLVTLDTLHRYCDGSEPTEVACRYDRQVRKCKSVTHYLLFFLAFSSLSNSFFPSIFMQKWKTVGRELLLSSKLLL